MTNFICNKSRNSNLLSTGRKNLPSGQLPPVLGVGLSAFCLKKKRKSLGIAQMVVADRSSSPLVIFLLLSIASKLAR